MAPATLTSLDLFGIPLKKQVAFTEYADNISAFIFANSTRRVVVIGHTPLGLLNSKISLPLNPPHVQFVLQKEVNHEQGERLLSKLGNGASKWKTGKTTIFKTPTLPKDMESQLMRTIAPHYNCGRDAVTPPGMVAFRFLSSAIAELLRVHTYAAFPTLDDSLLEIRTIHHKDINGTRYTTIKNKDGELARAPESISKFLGEHYDEDASKMDLEDAESQAVKKLLEGEGIFVLNGQDAVVTAKPSPINSDVNIGLSSDVPNMPGLLFPYFHGMIQPDSTIMKSFIVRRLFQILGDSVENCQRRYLDIRRGVNSLSTTDVGMAMSHIVLGVDLALQTQTRCFLIIESNVYKGFTLMGGQFAIFDSNKFRAPETEEELRNDISLMDPHLSAIEDLSIKMRGLAADGKYTGPEVLSSTFDDPANLIPVLKGIQLDKLETEDEVSLNAMFRNLNYIGTGYLQKNPQLVAETLEMMYSESAITLTRPTYIPNIRAPIDSKEFILLSRFGPDAPSLWNEKGQTFKCEARETPSTMVGGKRKIGQLDTFANMPEKILITPKPLSIAVKDMMKVNEQGAVKMDLKERAGKYRNISVDADAMKKRIWEALVGGLQDTLKRRKMNPEKKKVEASADFDELFNDLLS